MNVTFLSKFTFHLPNLFIVWCIIMAEMVTRYPLKNIEICVPLAIFRVLVLLSFNLCWYISYLGIEAEKR